MRKHLRRGSVRLLLVAVLAAVGAGFAYAAIPDKNGVIHACRTTFTGALRVIDTDVGAR